MNPILHQHRTIEYLFRELKSDGHRRDLLRLRLLGDLAAHISAELYVLYPAVGRALPLELGHEMNLLRRARELLLEVTGEGVARARFRERLGELEELFVRHVDVQEKEILPACAASLDEGRLAAVLDDVARFSLRLAATPRQEKESRDSLPAP